MTTLPEPDDEFTELTDAHFDRVDLVRSAANGTRFLITKSASSALLDPATVRNLITKSEPDTGPSQEGMVTVSGTPAAIAAMIHEAAQDAVTKATLTGKKEDDLPDSDFAYIEPGGHKDDTGRTVPRSLRHFPIEDAAHVRNALARASQSPFGEKAMPKIKAAAKKFGIDVAKADDDDDTLNAEGPDSLDASGPVLTMPDDDTAPGDPDDPGSPAWESIDSATAERWLGIIARTRIAVETLSDREHIEAVTGGDPDDEDNSLDLQDVCSALDFAISVLAPYAVSEQSEADKDAAGMVAKAMPGIEQAPLTRLEYLAAVVKAGRVLSSRNEAEIRSAAASLQTVLASLPSAPTVGDDVTEEQEGSAVTTDHATPKPVRKADDSKSDSSDGGDGDGTKTAMQAVFDQDGKLVGICDPGQIVPVTGTDSAPDPAPAPDASAAAADAQADGDADLNPQPPADAGTPADDTAGVTKTASPDDETITMTRGVLKSLVRDAVTAALESAPPAESDEVAKSDADAADLADQVRVLKERVAALEAEPAAPKVFTHGQVPPADQLRGQDRPSGSGPRIDVAKARERKAAFNSARDATEQDQIAKGMLGDAITLLDQIHGRK